MVWRSNAHPMVFSSLFSWSAPEDAVAGTMHWPLQRILCPQIIIIIIHWDVLAFWSPTSKAKPNAGSHKRSIIITWLQLQLIERSQNQRYFFFLQLMERKFVCISHQLLTTDRRIHVRHAILKNVAIILNLFHMNEYFSSWEPISSVKLLVTDPRRVAQW